MQLDTIVRFHAREGQEETIASAMREAASDVCAEPGCLGIDYFRSTRDLRLFYIHSRWRDEAAFEIHADLPHTTRFLDRIAPAIDHELYETRVRRLDF
jgi:quinol monooxygenase YgiN